MMRSQQIRQAFNTNKHVWILVMCACLGVVINVLFLVGSVLPSVREQDQLRLEQSKLQSEYALLMARPLPNLANEADLAALYRQVPRTLEQSQFMMSLKEIERRSGISINLLSSESSTHAGNEGNAAVASLVEEKMMIQINGAYNRTDRFKELNAFMNGLYQLERITQINSLTYTANNHSNMQGLEVPSNWMGNYEVHLNISIFSRRMIED